MLKSRSDALEIMDDLSISGPAIDQTLKELNIINRTLGGNAISLSGFRKLIKNLPSFTLADLGCGGGDIMKEMASWSRRGRKKGLFIGVDANPHVIDYAKRNTVNFSEISYQSVNIFNREFKQQTFDIIHCCLFLHHFSKEDLIQLFRYFKKNARVGIIVNDLHRHPIAYWSISVLTRLFSKSSMVRHDAAVSVTKGFKRKELIDILKQAGINNYKLNWRWAFRWKLIF
ncbi:MAG: methyltransferase domain-containing protein [Ekhidna sp.]|nr:methyltransferase domain-containing protein [Ekhidna sp.]